MQSDISWLLLVNSLSGENKTARMRIWRALKASGAGTLRDGVALLPQSDAARTVFAGLATQILAAGGSAHMLSLAATDEAQQRDFVGLFDRGAEYAALLERLRDFKAGIARHDEIAVRGHLAGLRRDIAALVAIDFFPGPARQQVEDALADGEAAVNARYCTDEPHALAGHVPRRDRADYRGRTWATRERLWVDRVASAWLIRRWIDPKAKFLWLKRPKDCPKTALGFDFDGAAFTHIGGRVSFEVIAAAFGLDRDPAIARLGALVHYLDVGGVAVPEAAGFIAILTGARARCADDDRLLADLSGVLDALHAAFSEAPSPAPRQAPPASPRTRSKR